MKAVVFTLGCKVNKYESDSLMNTLKHRGYEVSQNLEPADIYIINTCAVTKEAEKKSRQAIARCKKFNPDAKVFVVGCASQKNAEQFMQKDVNFVRGNESKQKILDCLDKIGSEIEELSLNYTNMDYALPSRIRSYIKIQDGCNNFCTYCIIPYLRGRSRSRDKEDILKEIYALDDSVKEIVLTGINVADFKINGKNGLLELLQEIDKVGKRIRLSSMEDCLVTEEFIKGLSELQNFCPHFHLSLQSGCDSVLKRMNRHYTTEQFENSVNLIRKYFPQAGITTDVIAGFCGETDEEARQTYEFVEKIKFSELHIFCYSPREGTVAYKMYEDLPLQVKKERAKKLEELGNRLKKEFVEKNKTEEVLFEEKENEYYIGYSKNYIKCYLLSKNDVTNSILSVSFTDFYKDGAICEIID
jgi:threonylcarbamoyladenosine tRNA methylthiotransferase MtaB